MRHFGAHCPNSSSQEFKEPRFYPLKQVVEIFSSPDPQGLAAEVRCLLRVLMAVQTWGDVRYGAWAGAWAGASWVCQLSASHPW